MLKGWLPQIGETMNSRAVVLCQLDDLRLRHTSTKMMLKEDLYSTMREMSDVSAECHNAENQVTARNRYSTELSPHHHLHPQTLVVGFLLVINRVVNELSKRLDSLTKEVEAKTARQKMPTRRFGQR
jgi:hypothetical protein